MAAHVEAPGCPLPLADCCGHISHFIHLPVMHGSPQVEYANVLIINKADLATPEQLDRLEHLLRRLNRSAQVRELNWDEITQG